MNLQDFKESVNLYLNEKIEPGSFVFAVLSNDLSESFGRADEESRENLFEFVKYLYSEFPVDLWGSAEIVNAHLKS